MQGNKLIQSCNFNEKIEYFYAILYPPLILFMELNLGIKTRIHY